MSAPPLDDEARFKLLLMQLIDDHIRTRFRTLEEAADTADVTWQRLSRLRSNRHELFSVGWLFKLAKGAGVRLRINVEPVS